VPTWHWAVKTRHSIIQFNKSISIQEWSKLQSPIYLCTFYSYIPYSKFYDDFPKSIIKLQQYQPLWKQNINYGAHYNSFYTHLHLIHPVQINPYTTITTGDTQPKKVSLLVPSWKLHIEKNGYKMTLMYDSITQRKRYRKSTKKEVQLVSSSVSHRCYLSLNSKDKIFSSISCQSSSDWLTNIMK